MGIHEAVEIFDKNMFFSPSPINNKSACFSPQHCFDTYIGYFSLFS